MFYKSNLRFFFLIHINLQKKQKKFLKNCFFVYDLRISFLNFKISFVIDHCMIKEKILWKKVKENVGRENWIKNSRLFFIY